MHQELEPSSQQLELLEEFDEVASHTDDNIDIMGMLMTFIAILHLSLPLRPSSNTNRSCGVIHEDLNPMTETSNTAAQKPDALFAVNTSFENQDFNQEEISVAFQQHQAPLDSNVSTQLMSQKCKICDASFSHPLQLRSHMKSVHNVVVPIECSICKKRLPTQQKFRIHMVSAHQTASGIPGKFQCTFCQESFVTVKGLKTHISEVHKAHKYKCNYCLKTFETKSALYSHNYRFHMKKKYGNNLPEKVLVPKELQQIHSDIKLHNSSVPAHVSSESNQQKIVIPDKNVANSLQSLPQAPIIQKQLTNMQQHVQTAQNLKRMDASKVATCHLSSARFTLQKHLKSRLKTTHKETELKYACGVDGCEKRYRHSGHLHRHEITHSKNLPFPCDYCDKSFSQRCNMRSHAIKIHGIAVPKLKKPNSFEQTPNADSTAVELPTQPLQMDFNNPTYAEREVGVPSWGQVQPEVCNGVESMTHYQSGYSNGLNPGINFTFPGANNPSSAITQQYDFATRIQHQAMEIAHYNIMTDKEGICPIICPNIGTENF
ncbi:putative zinc finger protein [Orchesella cincta]|uniref:Putative zinc finger protein n=1 Tax=Orchesella cincta TaxID=48709 RepID=A0A1D2MHJ0_ORCCI|nr:putative zinc finger protein [Orchesella cincta]